MRSMLIAATGALLFSTGTPVLAKGCIRGGAAGAVAGHYVGRGHAVAGAVVGCFAAHHYYAKKAREQRAAAKAAGH